MNVDSDQTWAPAPFKDFISLSLVPLIATVQRGGLLILELVRGGGGRQREDSVQKDYITKSETGKEL